MRNHRHPVFSVSSPPLWGMVTRAQARTPLPQVHTYIISYLKKEMPSVFGKENKKKQLIDLFNIHYYQYLLINRSYQ